MYFNFDTDPFSQFYVIEDEEHGFRRLSAEERERRLTWHLPPPRKPKPAQQPKEWHGEPWDESQDGGLDFAQADPGIDFDASDDGFDLPPGLRLAGGLPPRK